MTVTYQSDWHPVTVERIPGCAEACPTCIERGFPVACSPCVEVEAECDDTDCDRPENELALGYYRCSVDEFIHELALFESEESGRYMLRYRWTRDDYTGEYDTEFDIRPVPYTGAPGN